MNDEWNSLDRHDATGVPRRDFIDPGGIAPLLPNVFIVAAEGKPPRFRYRLVVSEIVAFTGRDLTGQLIDETTYGQFAAAAVAFFRAPLERRLPVGLVGEAVWIAGGEWMRIELLALALTGRDGAVDQLLGGYVRQSKDKALPVPDSGPAFRNLAILYQPIPQHD